MSKIEVDTVAPQSGTTLVVGESGDTVNLSNATVTLPTGTTDLVNDTTPQLGGALDINSQEITGSLIPSTTDTYAVSYTHLTLPTKRIV